jgi:hypothetical protein
MATPTTISNQTNDRCTFIAQPSQAACNLNATLGLNGCQRWLNDDRVSKLLTKALACRPELQTSI